VENITKKQMEATIVACAKKAEKAENACEALQYTQAALNAANAMITLHLDMKD
jgi:hypothetical protein